MSLKPIIIFMFKLKTALLSFGLIAVMSLCTVTAKAQPKGDTVALTSVDTLGLTVVDSVNHLAVTSVGDTVDYSNLVDAEIRKAVLDAVSTVLTEGGGKPWQWWIGQAVGLVFVVATIYFANRSEKFRKLYQEVKDILNAAEKQPAAKTKQHVEQPRSSSGKFVKKS